MRRRVVLKGVPSLLLAATAGLSVAAAQPVDRGELGPGAARADKPDFHVPSAVRPFWIP